GNDASIRSQVRDLLAVAPPERHAHGSLFGKLPRSLGGRRSGSCCRTERPDVEFRSSGLVGYIRHKARIRRKSRSGQLKLAAKDFDRLAFTGSGKRQGVNGATPEIGGVERKISPIHRPVR